MTAPPTSVTLVPFVNSLHGQLLERWLTAPHVVEWWGHTTPAQALASADGGATRIICAGGACVGFIRWHTLQRAELDAAGLFAFPDGGIDLDLFIGEQAYLGRGIGTLALREAMAELAPHAQAPFFTVCAETTNARALACYHKSGFVITRTFVEDGTPHHLLRCDAATSPAPRPSK